MKRDSGSKKRDVIFILAMVTFLGGGLWLFGEKHHSDNLYGWNRKMPVSASNSFNTQFLKKFESMLNAFLRDVQTQANDYRKERSLLNDLIKPENLKDPSFVKENYELSQALIPALRGRIKTLLQTFEAQDAQMRELEASQPAAVRAQLDKKWAGLKNQQLRLYADYFALEEEILTAHERLMALYFSKRAGLKFNKVINQIEFENLEDKGKEKSLRKTIESLQAQQTELLKG